MSPLLEYSTIQAVFDLLDIALSKRRLPRRDRTRRRVRANEFQLHWHRSNSNLVVFTHLGTQCQLTLVLTSGFGWNIQLDSESFFDEYVYGQECDTD